MKTVAIIGCGKRGTDKEGWAIGHTHAAAWQAALPDGQLMAVDVDAGNLTAFADKFQVPRERCFTSTTALYEACTPDIVSICTWPHLHHPQVFEAANAGIRGIVCEKPLALDGSEITEMLGVCARKGAHLVVAHQRRYEPLYEQARQLLKAGVLGQPLCLEARVGEGWDMLSWTTHWFDMADHLLDARPLFVTAGIDHTGQRRYRHAVENASIVVVEYDNASQGLFVTGPDAQGQSILVRGPDGHMRLSGAGIELFTRSGYQRRNVESPFVSGYTGLFADLVRVLDGDLEQTRCDAAFAAQATRTAYAAHDAAMTQRRIDLQQTATQYAPLEVLQHPPTASRLVGRAVLFADAHFADARTGQGGRDGLHDALLDQVAERVDMIPAETRELSNADLAGCDLLVLYHTVRTSTPQIRQLLEAYVRSGRPLVLAHCAIGAYEDWPLFQQWVGRSWIWGSSGHPHVPCTLKRVDAALAVPWDQAWLPRDEVYIRLGSTGPVKVLATMHADGIDDPAIWSPVEFPNIIVTLPGHRADVWRLPVMRDQLAAACRAVLAGASCRWQ